MEVIMKLADLFEASTDRADWIGNFAATLHDRGWTMTDAIEIAETQYAADSNMDPDVAANDYTPSDE